MDLPCIYRGPERRIDTCELCGAKGKPVPVYGCSVHGECAAGRYQRITSGRPLTKSCVKCTERTERD